MRRAIIATMIFVLIIATGCTRQEVSVTTDGKPIVKIGYLPITHAAPLFLSTFENQGEFENYKIELVKFGTWPDLMDALNTGRIDGASVLAELAMKAKELGIDLKGVALGHRDGNIIVTDPDLNSVEEMKGQDFAIPHKYSSHNILLNEMLKQDGLTFEDLNVVEMSPPEMPAALAEKRIAGYVVAEPFGALSIALGKGEVHYHSEELWPDSYCCFLVMRQAFLKENSPIMEDFIGHYVEAGKQIDRRNQEVYTALLNFMNVDKEVLDLSLDWTTFTGLRIEKDAYKKISELMVEMEMVKEAPTYEDFVDNTLIDKVM